jgi:hypothetical protein
MFDEVLFCRPLRLMLSSERLDQRAIFVAVLPRQDRVLRQDAVSQRIEASQLVIAAARCLTFSAKLISKTPFSTASRSDARFCLPDSSSRSNSVASRPCANISALNTAD